MAAMREAYEARERAQDMRFASLMALLANLHRDPRKRPAPFTASDFVGDPRPQTQEEFDARLGAFVACVRASSAPRPKEKK